MSAAPAWYADTSAWVAEAILSARGTEELVAELCQRLVAGGLPLGRCAVAFGMLNPLFRSGNVIWRDNRALVAERFTREGQAAPEWLRSPMKLVMDGPPRFRAWRLPDPEAARSLPLLHDLVAEGFGFYATHAIGFGGSEADFRPPYDGLVVSWSGREAEPFLANLPWLERLGNHVGAIGKVQSREGRALSLLRTYFGPLVGPRIWQGQIARGDVEDFSGVLWYSDLRESTALAGRLGPAAFAALLNQLFDCTAGAVEAAGGSVLKFVGDAVLAVFPQPLPEAATAALAAAASARALQAAANAARAAAGESTFRFGISLRTGSLLLGNVGTPSRLDFTLVGPAVNEVVRMEELTKGLPAALVIDAAVAASAPGPWRALGRVALRGVTDPLELFTPAA